MECIVHNASMYLLCYDDIDGRGDFFQSRSKSKCASANFLLILCSPKCGILCCCL